MILTGKAIGFDERCEIVFGAILANFLFQFAIENVDRIERLRRRLRGQKLRRRKFPWRFGETGGIRGH
jgi:hypothetical protein